MFQMLRSEIYDSRRILFVLSYWINVNVEQDRLGKLQQLISADEIVLFYCFRRS